MKINEILLEVSEDRLWKQLKIEAAKVKDRDGAYQFMEVLGPQVGSACEIWLSATKQMKLSKLVAAGKRVKCVAFEDDDMKLHSLHDGMKGGLGKEKHIDQQMTAQGYVRFAKEDNMGQIEILYVQK